MSEQAWTKEPWRVFNRFGIEPAADGERFCFAKFGETDMRPLDECEANAQRAVACVNALAGLKPEGVAVAVEYIRGQAQLGAANSSRLARRALDARSALEALGVSE